AAAPRRLRLAVPQGVRAGGPGDRRAPGRQQRPDRGAAREAATGPAHRSRPRTPGRAVLIDDLKEIQDRAGYLPETELQEYSARTNTPLYKIEAVASFYPFFRREPPPRAAVAVCSDLSCHLRGAEALFSRLQILASAREEVELTRCSCIGLCDQAPAVLWNEHPAAAAALPDDPFAGGAVPRDPTDRTDPTDRSDRMARALVTPGAPPQPFTI